ncbi:MAG: transketolase family protein [Actinobacteria bacterium]|nr:transketolase family protein [Actinomycetota bacterium]
MLLDNIKNPKIASIRESYGKALVKYGAENEKIVVLDADVSNSTLTKYFNDAYPERFFNVGIAEAGMIDTAAGLALEGYIPFVNAFASLICYRALEQIRTCVSYTKANVKIIAGYAGVSDYKDGSTHHSLFDISVMRAMPNMAVLVSADAIETEKMVKIAADYDGPVYLRLSRADMPVLFTADHEVLPGKGVILRPGHDITFICSGTLLHRALLAAESLADEGISARVLEIHTIKPLDSDIVLKCAAETGAFITIEENNIIGGLFSAISELLILSNIGIPVEPLGIKDCYSCTAPDVDSLLDFMGFDMESILKAAKRVLNIKSGRIRQNKK